MITNKFNIHLNVLKMVLIIYVYLAAGDYLCKSFVIGIKMWDFFSNNFEKCITTFKIFFLRLYIFYSGILISYLKCDGHLRRPVVL